MQILRVNDIFLAVVLSLAVVWLAFVKGDALYLGVWYYFAVPIVILGACAVLRPTPLFLTGTSLGIAITLLCVMSINWGASRLRACSGLVMYFHYRVLSLVRFLRHRWPKENLKISRLQLCS